MYQIDIKFDRQLRPATETSWVVVKQFQDGARPPFWKSLYRHYLSKKSSDFDEILYTAADFELDERHVIKNEKVALYRLQIQQNVFPVNNNNGILLPRALKK